MSTMTPTKRYLTAGLGALFGLVSLYGCNLMKLKQENHLAMVKALDRLVWQTNETLPLQLDEATQITNLAKYGDIGLEYFYVVDLKWLGLSYDDETDRNSFKEYIRKSNLVMFCERLNFHGLENSDFKAKMTYTDKTGNLLSSNVLNQLDCE